MCVEGGREEGGREGDRERRGEKGNFVPTSMCVSVYVCVYVHLVCIFQELKDPFSYEVMIMLLLSLPSTCGGSRFSQERTSTQEARK